MTSISKTKPHTAILVAFDPLGGQKLTWPQFQLPGDLNSLWRLLRLEVTHQCQISAKTGISFSSKIGQSQDWKFASDFASDLAMIRSQYKISDKIRGKFPVKRKLFFGTYLALIILSAKSVAKSETNFQSWD